MKPNNLPSPGPDAAHILRERAQALARPPEHTPDAQTSLELLEFRLAQERYALETRYVSEVYPLKDLTPLPCTPPFVLGIVNVRGRITPVIDIKKFFDLPDQGLTDLHRVILVRGDDIEFGLLADVIVGVHSVALEDLQPSLPTLTGIRADYLKGVTAERLVVLDLERILADPKIIVQEDVES
ncbi:chemotaxis protein CheW [Polaromonas sp.]|uniref:chemotaxis protein CheW n=1 Tax=Polaromonas sp. TaxID=1869339 RepID=UPI002FC90A8D